MGVSLVITCLGLEVGLRFMPVSDGLRGLPVNADNPIYRFAPNLRLRWTKGWNFSLANEIVTNNEGFISNVDYDAAATIPLLAVIGDSYVEAAMVPYDRTASGILGRLVEGHGRVYSFGASGAALSQYLAYARYVRKRFNPAGMVMTIVGNDFDESLLKYRRYPGFHYFMETPEGGLELTRLDRSVPWWKNVVVRSALGRYIVMNLEVGNLVERFTHGLSAIAGHDLEFVGNVDATVDKDRRTDALRAVDAFLRLLPSMSGLEPRHVLLVVDAPRPEIYSPVQLHVARNSFLGDMRRYLIERASAQGFEVIDLEKVFVQDYQKRGMTFEHKNDYHWNETGHELVAAVIRRSSVYDRVFQLRECAAGCAR